MSRVTRILAGAFVLLCAVGKAAADVVPFSGSFASYGVPVSQVTIVELASSTSYGFRTTPIDSTAEILWPDVFGVFVDVPSNADGIVLHLSPGGYVDGVFRVEIGSVRQSSAEMFHPTKPMDILVSFPEDLERPFGMWWGFTANSYPSDMWVRPVGWHVSSPVPEPKAWATMLAGFVILGVTISRRKQERRARIIV